MFAINVWITVMASANWFSKFDDVKVVPNSWDMLEKVGEVECSSMKDRAVVREQQYSGLGAQPCSGPWIWKT